MSVTHKKILVTGAGGIVGTGIRPFLARQFDELVLLDRRAPDNVAPNERVVIGDMNDPSALQDAMTGITGVVHLACAYGLSISFEDTFQTNYRGFVSLMETFVGAGGTHFVFASSHHGWGYYPRGEAVEVKATPRPDGWYGVSKVFGEAALAHLSDSLGFSALSVRLGNVDAAVLDERRTHIWMSFRDVADVIARGLTRAEPGHLAVFATADCNEPFFDNSDLAGLGFTTRDRPEDNLGRPEIATEKRTEGIGGEAVGGAYAQTNFKTDIETWRRANSAMGRR